MVGTDDSGITPIEDVDVGVWGGRQGYIAEFLVDAGDGFPKGYPEIFGGNSGD